jgi:toxin-antitoxin system PIN domain toxin
VSRFLLDVNLLIALIDPAHFHHYRAHQWFSSGGSEAWATCPLTQNGVLRIVGSSRYTNSPGTPAAVVPALASLLSLPGHAFWQDDISFLDRNTGTDIVRTERLLNSAQLTDSYLLALAVAHHGQLATFDRRLNTDAVVDGRRALFVIEPGVQ